jgi:hypothetical protein
MGCVVWLALALAGCGLDDNETNQLQRPNRTLATPRPIKGLDGKIVHSQRVPRGVR